MLGHGSLVDKINVLPFESIKRNIERVGQFSSCFRAHLFQDANCFLRFRPNISIFAYQSRAHFCGYRDKENTPPALGACTHKGGLPVLRHVSVL